jgi:GNAT superfamily N-acetyltransferase
VTAAQALAFVRKHGVVLVSAGGPAPRLTDAIAGEPVHGSWWAHPKGREIFGVLQAVTASNDVLVCRLIDGKVTLVHRRLWPALVRVAPGLPKSRVSQVRQEHTAAGHHVNRETMFPDWVPAAVKARAAGMSEAEALATLGRWKQNAAPDRPARPPKTHRPPNVAATKQITVRPLTPARWADLETVFNAKGCSVARGCWCMFYRHSGATASPPRGMSRAQASRADLKALVDGGRPPGLIGYRGREPVGWVSLGPREEFRKLERSPIMKAVDDKPVWSIVCFVVPAPYRGQGVARALLDAAIDYARRRGARLVEAYPVDKRSRAADDTMWFGAKSMYDRAGFAVVARRRPHRPVVRLKLA